MSRQRISEYVANEACSTLEKMGLDTYAVFVVTASEGITAVGRGNGPLEPLVDRVAQATEGWLQSEFGAELPDAPKGSLQA